MTTNDWILLIVVITTWFGVWGFILGKYFKSIKWYLDEAPELSLAALPWGGVTTILIMVLHEFLKGG